jgi:hypothetical protein
MSTSIHLGDNILLRVKYVAKRAYAFVTQNGKGVARITPINWAALHDPDRTPYDDRVGYHIIRQTITKEYRDSPVHTESRLILARFDGEKFFYVSPNQVGRESGATVDFDRANTKYERPILPAGIKRFLLSYPNEPEHQRILATLKLDENLTMRLLGVSHDFTVTIDDVRGQGHRPMHCKITKWHPLYPQPALDGVYLVRIHHDGSTTYTTVRFAGGTYEWPEQIPALQWPGALIKWAGITEECSKLLSDIVA